MDEACGQLSFEGCHCMEQGSVQVFLREFNYPKGGTATSARQLELSHTSLNHTPSQLSCKGSDTDALCGIAV